MTTMKKVWGSQVQIIGSGDGYATLSGTTEELSSNVDLETDGYVGAHVIVEMDYDSTPTDEVNISVYGSLNGTDFDDTPIFSQQGDHDVDPQQISIIITDLANFRIGVAQTGSTDSHNVRAYYQPWRYATV